MTPSGSVPSPSLDAVSSLGLAAFPRARRQDASKSVSTTDVSRHEHPPKHHLRRPSADHRGKTRRCSALRIALGSRVSAGSEDHAGPPCGHPASNGRALDGVLPASGLSTLPLHAFQGMGGGESVAAFSAGDSSVESSPLTSLGAAGSGTPEQPFASRVSPFPPEHVNAPMFRSPRCLPPEKTTRALLREPIVERRPRWPTGATAAHFHRCSRTSTRPLVTRSRV